MRPAPCSAGLALLAGALLAPGPASSRLVISEWCCHASMLLGGPHFLELLNTGNEEVLLSDGVGAWYLSSDPEYYLLPSGLQTAGGGEYTYAFPMGATLAPHQVALLTVDDHYSSAFGFWALTTLPARPPILFELVNDADAYPGMVPVELAASQSPQQEFTALFYWDGVSDRVQDGDLVRWGAAPWPDRAAVSIDGPDLDTAPTPYAADGGSGSALPAWDFSPGPGNGDTPQRISTLEYDEWVGGNGLYDEDETTEDLVASFEYMEPTPGRIPTWRDGDVADLRLAGGLVAVSDADGQYGFGPPGDANSEGTITELYALPVDDDGDYVADTLRVGLRGHWYADPASTNAVHPRQAP